MFILATSDTYSYELAFNAHAFRLKKNSYVAKRSHCTNVAPTNPPLIPRSRHIEQKFSSLARIAAIFVSMVPAMGGVRGRKIGWPLRPANQVAGTLDPVGLDEIKRDKKKVRDPRTVASLR